MGSYKKEWLAHLEDSVPKEAFGYTVSMYSIALEGWRRGLTLKFINVYNRKKDKYEINYSFMEEGNERKFSVTRGDLVPKEAVRVCINKDLTKDYLLKAKVPTPEGEVFGEDATDEEIINYAKFLGFPLVLKPSDGTGGNGVIANIKDEEEFKEALNYVKYDLKFPKLIVERFAAGEDYRLYVIGGEVIGAFKKIPANVIGNGTKSIQQLLKEKNAQRNQVPAFYNRPIKVDKETHTLLRSQGYTMDSVPEKNERVFLKTKNNVSSGGDPIDVTEELTNEIKEIAIKASEAIPGLVQCGVDMIVDMENNKGVILEINSRPHITSHLYPMEGQARDIPKAIIDYHFPDTVSKGETKALWYIDYKFIKDSFKNGAAKEITLPDIPGDKLNSVKFIVSGSIKGVNYEKWIQSKALGLKLSGHIKYLKNGKAEVVVSGTEEALEDFKRLITKQSSKKAKVKNVVEKEWNKPIKIGFEIISNNSVDQADETQELEKEIRKVTQDKKELKQKADIYKKKYNAVIKSRIWRFTKPVRIMGSYLRRLLKK
ncbi:acylphosphatase [Evansella clarkii]|uniref:acylphosphatase n=1 Tax=Evansella clarkii TaxID=79879 RepID=UPI000B442665|nr:acylphosphatase [Evansella clarkii]